MRLILQYILNILARRVLKKYHPEVIGITGSVGKTSTKEAVFAVLSGQFRVRRNVKNYNNEIGVPLSILGCETGGKSLFKWLGVFFKGWGLIFKRDPNYPEILILEMGADRPGDIRYLTDLAPCKVGVVTAVGPTHVEFFKTVAKVVREKQIIVTHLKRDGVAILNADDELVLPMRTRTEAEVISFGISQKADLKALELKVIQEMEKGFLTTEGINFKMQYGGSVVPVFLAEVVGRQHIYAALAATAVGLSYGLNLVEIAERLRFYQAPPSRMHLVPGIKFTTIIDDTYNSSPLAAKMALEILSEIQVMEGAKRIAVLGDMLELGGYTEEAHRQIGKKVAELKIDFLLTVGERAKFMADEALKSGLNENQIVKFAQSEEAGRFLQEKIQSGDLILIKGSQGVRMEKIVKEIMANPLEAEKLVCRQSEEWLKR